MSTSHIRSMQPLFHPPLDRNIDGKPHAMRDDPQLDIASIAATLESGFGLREAAVRYLPIGYDMAASVYEVTSEGGERYFLKVRSGPVHEPSLQVSRALIDVGIEHVLAPLRTQAGQLWFPFDGYPNYTAVLYPFVPGENAMIAGMTEDQWRTFGATLRTVHDSGLAPQFQGQLPVETFDMPSAALVRAMLVVADGAEFESPAAAGFAAFWREQSTRITQMLMCAEELGASLQAREFELVLCHADIHAANILVGDDGRIHLIDWDGPKIAPRERDLLFVIGSRIARKVERQEEAWFFDGYGPVEIDPLALIYYRYERIVDDFGEFGKSVFLDPTMSEPARQAAVDLATQFFSPGGDIDRAETVTWSASSDV